MKDPHDLPWHRDTCLLRRGDGWLLLFALLAGPRTEDPCDRCNESRAKCGGYPRKDGDPRP